VVAVVLEDPDEILEQPDQSSVWDAVLDSEPRPHRLLEEAQIDDALLSAGAFTDLVSPDFTGHSMAVGELAGSAAAIAGCSVAETAIVRRAGYLHDLGRICVPFAVWQRPGKVDADGWEKIRLHAYHTERLLSRSPFLAVLGVVAGCHHERLDGSGYHRGLPAAGLGMSGRLLAAADAYRTKTEPRPHRAALALGEAAAQLRAEAAAGRLDPDGVAVVLEAAGHRPGDVERPDGLTARERQTLILLAQGRATKQIARELGVTPKTADHYVQRMYRKIGVSTRAAAAVYAMQHGFVTWENTHS
jgi:HD-GYP domain-containing protein (c-di-GMP phosphodiesterase class II)